MKSRRSACHSFNEEILEEIRENVKEVDGIKERLCKAKDKVFSVIGRKHQKRSTNQKTKENKWKIKMRAKKKSETLVCTTVQRPRW